MIKNWYTVEGCIEKRFLDILPKLLFRDNFVTLMSNNILVASIFFPVKQFQPLPTN